MAFVGLLFGLAAVLWSIPLLRHCSLPIAGFLVLVVGTIFGPSFFAIDSVVQVSLDRLLWAGMLAMFVIYWRLGRTGAKPLTRGDVALFLFVGLLAISSQRGAPPSGSSPLARWLFYVFLPMGSYWVARSARITRRDIEWITQGLIVLALYLGITGILEVKGVHSLVLPTYIVEPGIVEFFGRARGPLLNPAGNGIVLGIGLAAATLRFLDAGRVGRLLYGAAVLVIMLGVYATLTRGVWIGAILVLGIIGVAYAPRWLRVWGLAFAVLLAGAVTMGLKDQLLAMKRDKHLSAEDAAKSISLRPLLAIVAYEMFKDAPLMGHGFGHYSQHSKYYYDNRSYDLPLDQARDYVQHNVLLSLLADTGLLGVSCFVAALLFWTARAWKLARDAMASPGAKRLGLIVLCGVSTYFFNGMFQDVLVIPMVHMYLFYLGGLLVGVSLQDGVLAEDATSPRSSAPIADRRTGQRMATGLGG